MVCISIGDSGVWAVDGYQRIFKLNRGDMSWTPIKGKLVKVSSGASVWGVSLQGIMYKYHHDHDNWEQINRPPKYPTPLPGRAARWNELWRHVSVSNRNHVWGVSRAHKLYRRRDHHWQLIEGEMILISVGESGVWAVNKERDVYYRTGTYGDADTAGYGWKLVPGKKMELVSVGTDLVVAIAKHRPEIYLRKGINEMNPTGTHWVKVTGRLNHIDVNRDVAVGLTPKTRAVVDKARFSEAKL